MSKKTFTGALAVLLIIALVAPSAFLIAPQKVSAASSGVSCIGGLLGGALGGIGGVASTLVAVPVSDAADIAVNTSTMGTVTTSCIYEAVLIPLARAALRAILMQMTASVISWITGKSNGTGSPQFVVNIQGNLQSVGDTQMTAFFAQFGRNMNSQFAGAISSALRINYLQQTSMAGFFAANRNTLPQYTANPNAFVAGNWPQQGGIGTWLALTTQDQNNPYMLYQNSQSALSSMITDATSARQQELSWGQGFLSWCGVSDIAAAAQGQASTARQDCIAQCNGNANGCIDTCDANFAASGAGVGGATGSNAAAGSSCTNSDGTPGKIQTPGSVIHDYTQAFVVNSGMEQLISANDLDMALGAIVGALLNQVLGTVSGLLGASQPSGRSPALTAQLRNFSPSSVTATQTTFQTAQTTLDQATTYVNAWNIINTAATAASTSVSSLASACNAVAATNPDQNVVDVATLKSRSAAQAQAAQTALTTVINPVIAQARREVSSVTATQTFALQVQTEASGGTIASSTGSLASDIAMLVAMPPSIIDVTNAQANASAGNNSVANPTGSLTVSRGSLVDQMNLLNANAQTLLQVCSPATYPLNALGGSGD